MYGKIISKEEADKQFGPVIESVAISVGDLTALIKQTDKSVMFKIINGELHILGDGRKVLRPAGRSVKSDVEFHHYSKEIVLEIINGPANSALGAAETTLTVERRAETLTVTNGANTLEFAAMCPPFCI